MAGEPGIGKTRLTEELAERAGQVGAEVLWVRCDVSRFAASYLTVTLGVFPTFQLEPVMRFKASYAIVSTLPARLVKVFEGQSDLIAIASRVAGTLFQPKVVFVG